MGDIPEKAVQAAADAISRKLFSEPPSGGTWMDHDKELARAAVEAAAPILAAHIAHLIRVHKPASNLRRTFVSGINCAARVASRAFQPKGDRGA
ncbi:hypothetical protein [Acrocarpospora catenulata]|uniref:hypothetical protein n=1 Tax=Acrocarpospora catenulata TaxID=2836182 RepID=UPI001BDAC94C|nr:hypothetical protein [Acrocarpospora catenulata]